MKRRANDFLKVIKSHEILMCFCTLNNIKFLHFFLLYKTVLHLEFCKYKISKNYYNYLKINIHLLFINKIIFHFRFLGCSNDFRIVVLYFLPFSSFIVLVYCHFQYYFNFILILFSVLSL